jgi:multiple sugar transport system ATP-binding protein
MAEVKLKQVSKIYPGGFCAADKVDITIADREFVVLVGPSGCGKSTTLRMIAGLEDITSGELMIGGKKVNHVPPRDRDIAMVFQSYALYPHMSVAKNLAFGLLRRRQHSSKLRKVISADYRKAAQEENVAVEERVASAAKMLGLTDLLERKPGELSGGQRQRVAVGRAIVRDPKAFLFDEPLSNLDAKLRVEMRTEIRRLHREMGATTIYVTHDQEEAMTLGDRLVVMKDGVIQQIGSPTEVYEKPTNRFVASFVGTPPMNFFEGDLVQQADANAPADAVLGIRPDAIQPLLNTPDGDATGNTNKRPKNGVITAKLVTAENLGDRTDLILVCADGTRIVSRTAQRRAWQEDSDLQLTIDPQQVHYFAAGQSGERLSKLS